MASINKSELEHLAELARIKLEPSEEEKFLKDFQKILDHFAELSALPLRPTTGLKAKRVPLREDSDILPDHFAGGQKIIDAFPESERGLLKIPPIFE